MPLLPSLCAALAAALLLTAPGAAQQPVRVVDGDTIEVDGRRVRILGLDAPELHGRCPAETALAEMARDRLAGILAAGAIVTIIARDRYNRPLAVVRDAAGRDVAPLLISAGLARPYAGERRQGWC